MNASQLMGELALLVEAAGKGKGFEPIDAWQAKQAQQAGGTKGKPGLSQERVDAIKAMLAKLDFGFKQTKSDFAIVDDIGLTPEEVKELAPYTHISKKQGGKKIIFAKAIPVWLSKSKALETMFLPGVGGGAMPTREIRGKMAGATPAEVRAGGNPIREPERPFVGGFFGAATHQQPYRDTTFYKANVGKPKGESVTEELAELLEEAAEGGEKPLSSQTATTFRSQLKGERGFENFVDDDWLTMGQWAKKKGLTKSVFTGALSEFLMYLSRNPKGMPLTSSYADKALMRSGVTLKLKNATGSYILGVLEADGVVEKLQSTAKESLKGLHTEVDEKMAKESPQKHVDLWWPSDGLRELVSFLKRKKVQIRAESFAFAKEPVQSFEIEQLQEMFG